MDFRGSESFTILSASFSSPLDRSWLPSSVRGQSTHATANYQPNRNSFDRLHQLTIIYHITKAKLMLLSQQGRTGGCLHFTVVRRRLLPWLFAPYAATLRGSVMVMFLLVFDKNLPHQFLRRRQQLTFAQLKSQG